MEAAEKERDFEAGDKILIDGERLAIVTCVHSVMGKRGHGLNYKEGRWIGWVHPSICRRITDEEWAARILMDGKQ